MGAARGRVSGRVPARHGRYVPPVGEVLPRRKYEATDVAKAQADVLHSIYGDLKSPAKQQAREMGQTERACREQQSGNNCMSLTAFFNACNVREEVREWGLVMMGLAATNDPRFQEEFARGVQEIRLKFDFEGGRLVPKVSQ